MADPLSILNIELSFTHLHILLCGLFKLLFFLKLLDTAYF